jgi:hypothetical protein
VHPGHKLTGNKEEEEEEYRIKLKVLKAYLCPLFVVTT